MQRLRVTSEGSWLGLTRAIAQSLRVERDHGRSALLPKANLSPGVLKKQAGLSGNAAFEQSCSAPAMFLENRCHTKPARKQEPHRGPWPATFGFGDSLEPTAK